MLSKYNASDYTPTTVINYDANVSFQRQETKNIVSYTPSFKKWNISLYMYVWDSTGAHLYIYVKKNGTTIYSHTDINTELDTTITIENVLNTDTITLDAYNPDSTYWRTTHITANWVYTRAKEYIPKKSIPFVLKNIWAYITCYLFGKLPNGVRWDGN